MPLKCVNKTVFAIAALVCGAMYILLSRAFNPVEGAYYRTQQLLVVVYLLYLLLITPFDPEHIFARVRGADYTEYTLVFLLNLTGIAAAYWVVVTAEVWLLGSFIIHDNMSINTAISPMVHLFINLMFFNIFHIVLCRFIKNTAVRKTLIYAFPLVLMSVHYFGSPAQRRFIFTCYGTIEQPVPYVISVYAVVFAVLIFLMLKKNRREYD